MAKTDRVVTPKADQAQKYYPTGENRVNKKVRKTLRDHKPRASLQPGTVVILLAGRFRGKRVVLLNNLSQGVLLVTGPFKVNGVPLRRVNARYVIATSTKVDISSVEKAVIDKASEDKYFARDRKAEKKGEEAFFKQGEKPEPKKINSERAEDQKKVDKAILGGLKKEPFLQSYLASSFSLRNGDKPHEMIF